jgi:hypothetical protein
MFFEMMFCVFIIEENRVFYSHYGQFIVYLQFSC